MDAVTELKEMIKELEKSLSLRQIALQSGVNYITMRNIKFGKSSRVTDGVSQRLIKFYSSFDPQKAALKAAPKKRGRKKGSTAKPSAAPVASPMAAPAPLAASAPAPKPVAKPKGKKRGRKPGVKNAPATPSPTKVGDGVLAAINKEIAELDARIASLRKMRDDYKGLLG